MKIMRPWLALCVVVLFGLSACGGGGSGTAPVAPSGLSYPNAVSLIVGTAMTALHPTVSGAITNYSVVPALPAGVALDSSTGVISGTPTAAAATTTYVVTATNSAGATQFSLTMTVNPAPPTATLSVNSTTVTTGQWVTLTWTSTNATSCTASGGWSGIQAVSGSASVGPVTQATQYFLSCGNSAAQSPTQSVSVSATSVAARFAFQQSWNAVNDVAWDSARQVLYVAVGSNAVVKPNSIIIFDPVAGTIVGSVQAGSEPSALGMSDDGQYLYAGFRGTDVIKRYHLPDFGLLATFPANPTMRALYGEPLFADQLAVAPGLPLTVAVSALSLRELPVGSQLTILDDRSQRALNSYFGIGGYWATWNANASRLYSPSWGGTVTAIDTSPSQSTMAGTTVPSGTISGFTFYSTAYANGLLYDNLGGVFDGASLQRIRTLPTPGLVTVDGPNNTVFVATAEAFNSSLMITSYDIGSGTPRESINVAKNDLVNQIVIQPGKLRRMVRWGVDGLALVGIGGSLAIVSGPFVAAGGTSNPVGTIPGTLTSSSTYSLNINPSVAMTSLMANDAVWDSIHGLLLASIPMTATDHPSSIAIVDPATGNALAYVATTTEPGGLAISDDGQYLYVATALTLQRFRLPALTLDATTTLIQVAPGYVVQPGSAPQQISVRPGDSSTVAIGGFGVLTNISLVQQPVNTNQTLRWSSDGQTLYGLDSASTGMNFWSVPFSPSGTAKSLGSPLIYPFSANSGYPWGISFVVAGGLVYSDTGAVFDPQSGGYPGTLPIALAVDAGYGIFGSLVLATSTIDVPRSRAYSVVCTAYATNSVCGNWLVSFDLNTDVPLAVGGLFGISGWAYRVVEMSPTTFAIVTSSRQLALVSAPEYAR